MDLHIIPECYIDTRLVKVLVPPASKKYNHTKGCSSVAEKMKNDFNDDFAVGIIDKDKKSIDYAKYFSLVTKIEGRLELYNYKNHYLIFIIPAMEKWIISNAHDAKIQLADYGLPEDYKELTYFTKTSKDDKDDAYSINFIRLFKDLKNSGLPVIEVLKFWISYLKENPYNANLEIIQSETANILSNS